MKPHLMSASTLVDHSDNQDGAMQMLAQSLTVGDRAGRTQAVRARPSLTLASTPVWKHKLILTGKLDHSTVVELEDEIECLCEEGVTILTLDLHRLDAIDSVGARAIASGGENCKRRGRAFAVVLSSPVIHHALAEVGAEGLLADGPGEASIRQSVASVSGSPLQGTSTAMVKAL